jgi:hypothetical protein
MTESVISVVKRLRECAKIAGRCGVISTTTPLTTTPCKEGIVANRQCKRCGVVKPIESFGKHPDCVGGRAAVCKACACLRLREHRKRTRNRSTRTYEKTPQGFLMRTYRNMQSRVSGVQWKKAHLYAGLSLLPRETFYEWARASPEFHRLYKAWIDSGFDRKLTPSVDRIDSSRGYEIDNMQWLTHSDNSLRGTISRHRDHL